MRLTETQRHSIESAVPSIVGEGSRVWLFGSRVDDAQRGRDIDLLIETDQAIPNRTNALCRLEGALAVRLGDRKTDLLLKDARTADALIFRAARQQGVLL